MERTRRYDIQSVTRATALLKAFRDSDEITLRDLALAVDLPKASVFRIAATLESAGFLERTDNGYMLGLELLSVARHLLSRDFPEIARPSMEELHRSYGHTVNLAALDQGECLFVRVEEGRHSLRMVAQVGAREPIHATSIGKAMAAQLPTEVLDRILAEHPLVSLTPHTITSRARLEEALERTRNQGYACDYGEYQVGATCVAAPVFDRNGLAGALSISATAAQLPPDDVPAVGRAVRAAADRASLRLGADPSATYGPPGESPTP